MSMLIDNIKIEKMSHSEIFNIQKKEIFYENEI